MANRNRPRRAFHSLVDNLEVRASSASLALAILPTMALAQMGTALGGRRRRAEHGRLDIRKARSDRRPGDR